MFGAPLHLWSTPNHSRVYRVNQIFSTNHGKPGACSWGDRCAGWLVRVRKVFTFERRRYSSGFLLGLYIDELEDEATGLFTPVKSSLILLYIHEHCIQRWRKTDSPKLELPHNCDEALDANCLADTDTTGLSTELTFLCATGPAQHSQKRLIISFNTHTHTLAIQLPHNPQTRNVHSPHSCTCFLNQLFAIAVAKSAEIHVYESFKTLSPTPSIQNRRKVDSYRPLSNHSKD